MHDVDVVNKLDQELLHALRSCHELHDLIQGAIQLRFDDLTVDLEVLLESLECCWRIEMLFMEPTQLFVDILLREDKDLEFFGLNEVGALGDLLDKHAQ